MSKTLDLIFILTLVQFWWIAIWGLAYIAINAIAGTSKTKEIFIYLGMLFVALLVFHFNPDMLNRL